MEDACVLNGGRTSKTVSYRGYYLSDGVRAYAYNPC